jgi:hypothetical protein
MSDAATPEPTTQPKAARHRQRPPKSEEAKLRGLKARALQRALERVKASKDTQKMEKAAALLAQLEGVAGAGGNARGGARGRAAAGRASGRQPAWSCLAQ